MEAFSKGTFAIAKTLAEITEKVRQSELPVGNTRTLVGRIVGRIVLPHRTALASATASVLGRNPTTLHVLFCRVPSPSWAAATPWQLSSRPGSATRWVWVLRGYQIPTEASDLADSHNGCLSSCTSWRRVGCCWTDTLPDMQPFLPLGTNQERARMTTCLVRTTHTPCT